MRTITDGLLFAYLALRISNGSWGRRLSESVLFALFFVTNRLRR